MPLRGQSAEVAVAPRDVRWPERATTVLLAVVLLTLALWQFSWTARLGVDSFDGINYLLASRVIADGPGHTNTPYVDERPPLLPLVIAPLQLLPRRAASHWRLVHWWVLVISWLALVPCYLLFRLSFSRIWSLALVLLVAVCPLFTNYAALVSADILSAGCATACIVAFVKARRAGTWRLYVLAGVFLAGAMLSKYPLLVLPSFLVLVDVLLWLQRDYPADMMPAHQVGRDLSVFRLTDVARAVLRPRLVALCLVGTGVFHATQVAVTMRAFPDFSFAYANVHPYHMIVSMGRRTVGNAEQFEVGQAALGTSFSTDQMHPLHEYLSGAASVFSLPVCALALLGVGVAVRDFSKRRDSASTVAFGWLLFFPIVMTLLVVAKEMRYMFPAVPVLAYGVGHGWHWLSQRVSVTTRGAPSRSRLAVAAFGSLAVGGALRASVQHVSRLLDPVYTCGALSAAAEAVPAARDPQTPVLWSAACLRGFPRRANFDDAFLPGALHTVTPREPLPLRYDDFWGFFHLGPHTFEYLWDRPVGVLSTVVVPAEGAEEPRYRVSRDREGVCVEGAEGCLSRLTEDALLVEAFPRDGILLVPSGQYYFAPIHRLVAPAPYPPQPMEIVSVGRATLFLVGGDAQGVSYSAESGPAMRLELARGDDGLWAVTGEDSLEAWCILARETETGPPAPLGKLAVGAPPQALELVKRTSYFIDFVRRSGHIDAGRG